VLRDKIRGEIKLEALLARIDPAGASAESAGILQSR